jgi:hypothetical protein
VSSKYVWHRSSAKDEDTVFWLRWVYKWNISIETFAVTHAVKIYFCDVRCNTCHLVTQWNNAIYILLHEYRKLFVLFGLEVFTSATGKSFICWSITPCCPMIVIRHFKRNVRPPSSRSKSKPRLRQAWIKEQVENDLMYCVLARVCWLWLFLVVEY